MVTSRECKIVQLLIGIAKLYDCELRMQIERLRTGNAKLYSCELKCKNV